MTIDEKLHNMILAHLDGVYKFSARENCDELLSQIFSPLMTAGKVNIEKLMQTRNNAIEEVAKHYHEAMADFFKQEGDNEKASPGIAEYWHGKAHIHRSYAREIRNQVWFTDEFKPNKMGNKK